MLICVEGKKQSKATIYPNWRDVWVSSRLTKVQKLKRSFSSTFCFQNRNASEGKHASVSQAWPHRCGLTLVSYIRLLFDLSERRGIGSRERTINLVDTYVVKAGKTTSLLVVRNNPRRPIKRISPSSHTLDSLRVVAPRAEIRPGPSARPAIRTAESIWRGGVKGGRVCRLEMDQRR